MAGANNNDKKDCQEWDSNPCPFGPVPETGALDQLGHLDFARHWMSPKFISIGCLDVSFPNAAFLVIVVVYNYLL